TRASASNACRSTPCALCSWPVGCITHSPPARTDRAHGIANAPTGSFAARQLEVRLLLWTLHDERQAHRFEATRRVEGVQTDVAPRVRSAASIHFVEHRRRVLHIEHRHAPHLPVGIARMGILSELDRKRPALA